LSRGIAEHVSAEIATRVILNPAVWERLQTPHDVDPPTYWRSHKLDRPWHPDAPFLYAIQHEGAGLVKIGRSVNPKDRFRGLQNACPVTLNLVGFEKVLHPTLERLLHQWLDDDRAHGEWFRPTPHLTSVLERFDFPNWTEIQLEGSV